MAYYSDTVQDSYQRPVSGATVLVLKREGGMASLTDNGGAPLANPVLTDTYGRFAFNAVDGLYALEFRFGGATLREDDVLVGIPPQFVGPPGGSDNTYPTLAALLASDPTRKSARLVPQAGETEPAAPFSYINGAWVRQEAVGIQANDNQTVQAKLDQRGFVAQDKGAVPGQSIAPALASIFTALDAGVAYPNARIARGQFLLPTGQVLNSRHANVIGEGLNSTYLHATGAAGQVALTLKNFGGRTEYIGIDAGAIDPNAGSPASIATARSVERHGFLFAWDNGGQGAVHSIEARWFNGYGIRFQDAYDAVLSNLITRDCGQTGAGADKHYAVEFVKVGDTCNHLTINRLQVEDSFSRAILFDTFCLNIVVDGIHCEGTVGEIGVWSAQLLGTGMSFRNARFANDGGNFSALLGGAGNVYDRMTFEPGTDVTYSWGVAAESNRSVITNSIFDTVRIPATNTGRVTFRDCYIANLIIDDQFRTVDLQNCVVGAITLRGNASDLMIAGGQVTGAWSTAGNATVRCIGVRMTNCPTMYQTFLTDCTVTNSYSTLFFQQLRVLGGSFAGDLQLNNDNARVQLGGEAQIGGALTYGAGTAYGAIGDRVTVNGAIDLRWYGVDGVWPKGTSRHRPDAAAGQALFHRYNGTAFVAGPNAV